VKLLAPAIVVVVSGAVMWQIIKARDKLTHTEILLFMSAVVAACYIAFAFM